MGAEDPNDGALTFASAADTEGRGSFLATLGDVYARANPAALEADAARAFGDDLVSGRFGRLERAAFNQRRLLEEPLSAIAAYGQAYRSRIKTVSEATGVALEDPTRGGYRREAALRALAELEANDPDAAALVRQSGQLPETVTGAMQRKIFAEKLAELEKGRPDAAAVTRAAVPIDEDVRTMTRAAEAELSAAGEAPRSAVTTLAAELSGGFRSFVRDPLNVTTMFAGAWGSSATTAAGRIAITAAQEALVNAGTTALTQPAVQRWRAEQGLTSGVGPALENIGFAALFGGVFGGAFATVGEALRPGARALTADDMLKVDRMLRGEASPKETLAALDLIGARLSDDDRQALTTAARQAGDDADLPAAPAGVAPAEHGQAINDAIRHAEDPDLAPPPSPPVPAPKPKADQPVLADDRPAAAALGEKFTYDAKPVTRATFNPQELTTDAQTFQYKGGGDDAGVTARLRSVAAWDNLAAGNVIVFERADGTRVVADGHQRTGLARRLLEQDRSQNIQVGGFLFREVDGWTPADVRAIAAKKNIQEGSGSLLDTARVLRDRPDLWDATLPVSDDRLSKARALSKLSDEAWGAVINGVIDPLYASHIAALAPDPAWHAALVRELVDADPPNEAGARFLIADALAAGLVHETQETMFGLLEMAASLRKERAAVFDTARKLLAQEKRLFGMLDARASEIEAAGNQLAGDTNKARARSAGELAAIVERLATRAGPVSDALNRAALALSEGQAKSRVAAAFVADLADLVEREGFAGLEAREALAPHAAIEPGSAAAAAQAEALLGPGLFDETAPGAQAATETPAGGGRSGQGEKPGQAAAAGHLAALSKLDEFKEGQRGLSYDEVHARATALQDELGAAGDAIAAETGAPFNNPGVKDHATGFEKIARKRYEGPHELTDLARGGFIVDTPDQAEAIVAGLKARFADVLDEGWATTPVGYTDRKVLVRGADGTIAEVQIVPAAMQAAKKDKGGHKLYSRSRDLPADSAERAALDRQQKELYSAAVAELGPDWASAFGRASSESGPNLGSNVSRQAASGSTAPVSATSSSSTFSQGPDGLSTAKAAAGDTSTAGRQSQFTNVGDDISSSASNLLTEIENLKSQSPELARIGERFREDLQAGLREADQLDTLGDLVASCKE